MNRLLVGRKTLHRYYYFNEAINVKDCDNFVSKYKKLDFKSGEVRSFDEKNNVKWVEQESIRKAKTYWAEVNDAVVRAIWSYVLGVNQNYKFNLTGFSKAQLTRYNKGDFYGWHQDSFYHTERDKSERKLTAVLQLSKPEDYEGCELQLFNGENELEELPIKNQGSIVVFRSEEWHRVTKLTKGTRYSLVFWAVGSPLA
jgi:predicted 2-oxoglutarate/Fe(II)-dependent dioxygenase YbiX